MLFPSTKSWDDVKKLEGLLFYVLRLQELSYDQSDFTEKSIGHPASSLITELEQVIHIVEKGTIKGQEKELTILKDELKEKISSDPVSKKLLGTKIDRYMNCLDSGSMEDIKLTLELVDLKLAPFKYWEELKDQINEVVIDGKQKDKILNIANLTFEFLLDYGYEKGTIYHFINLIFFDKTNKKK